MSKTIIEGPKIKFNIEIELSEQQLKYLCEYAGDEEYNDLKYYIALSSNECEDIVSIHPSFCMGLGADINSILSVGFETLTVIDTQMKTKLSESDLKYHPFMCKRNEIVSIESKLIDCDVLSAIAPITKALDKDGNIIDLNEKDYY
jgi:hypothetical protein